VVFTGNGIARAAGGGRAAVHPAAFVAVPLLGIHPNAQGPHRQAVVIALIAAAVLASRRAGSGRRPGGRAH
jgi:hypothetical protein